MNLQKLTAVTMLAATASLCGCGARVEFGPVADARSADEIRKALGGTTEATSDGSPAGAAATGTGWGTLRGQFTFDGAPPQMSPYAVNKDQATCTLGGKAPLQETLLVDSSTKGIKNIAIYALKASRVHESAQPKTAPVVFDQKECVFLTHVCGVTVGQELDIKNSDNVGHNTNIAGRKNSFNQTIPAGESIPYKVQKEEATPAPVNCSIHPWMSAYLLPRPNAYYAITAADGTFEIPNLPAGEKLELQVWHESAAGPSGALVVTSPESKSVGWSNKGRFTVTLDADQTKEIKIVVPAASFGG